jgi:hypothetical protein
MAWRLVRAYYAAFYAGHALIRPFGESCLYFDRRDITRISTIGIATGQTPGFRLEAGLYRCRLSGSATAVECVNLRGGAGGTHELFWSVFGGRIKSVGEEVLRGPLPAGDAQLVFSKIDHLAQSMSGYGSPFYSWLSLIRNEIQYRQIFGVRFPCSVKKHEREGLSRLLDQWIRGPMTVDIGARQSGQLGSLWWDAHL